MSRHKGLCEARQRKNDEYYTLYQDVESEMTNYKDQLYGKDIYCNCDTTGSNFYIYFKEHYGEYGLNSLTATAYNSTGTGEYAFYDGITETTTSLTGNGSYDSEECLEILKDKVVITNPPFSLFRQYYSTITDPKYNTDFIVIASQTILGRKKIFRDFRDGKTRIGYDSFGGKRFMQEDGTLKRLPVIWLTSFPVKATDRRIVHKLTRHYTPEDYPKYDNYDCIEVSRSMDIPIDYSGYMGVPLSFVQFHNPDEFEIVGLTAYDAQEMIAGIPMTKKYTKWIEKHNDGTLTGQVGMKSNGYALLSGKGHSNYLENPETGECVHTLYDRLIIRRKQL